jgi:hypothetical protein
LFANGFLKLDLTRPVSRQAFISALISSRLISIFSWILFLAALVLYSVVLIPTLDDSLCHLTDVPTCSLTSDPIFDLSVTR